VSNRQKRLEKAQIRVLFNAPFFAPAVARLPVVFDSNIPTACTDGKEIRWSPEFFDSLADHELVTVLCHEVCHPMLGHIWRAPGGCDHRTWNIACDHAVNLMLQEFSALTVGKGKADPFPFPKPADAYCADPRFKGQSEEQIYRVLVSEGQNGGGSNGASAGGAQGSGNGTSQVSGQAIKTPVRGSAGPSAAPKAHSMPDFGQFSVPKPVSAGSEEAVQGKRDAADWQNTLIQAVQLCKGRGILPGELERLVDTLVNPRVPWSSVLRSMLREQCADDWNWSEPDLAMAASGFILPSLKSEKMGAVVFGSDWSGSTFGRVADLFHAEKQSCLDELRPRCLLDIGFDTEVVWEKEYAPGEVISREVKGGGGTCFKDLFRRCDELQPAPKVVVVLTDLCGSFPDSAPGYPVIWISTEKDGKAPFGEVIFADPQAS
jgi:predicted metal-dependent peptidase